MIDNLEDNYSEDNSLDDDEDDVDTHEELNDITKTVLGILMKFHLSLMYQALEEMLVVY